MERKEAIEIVRNLYNKSLFLKKDKEAIVTLIPEIKESEDEKIVNALIGYIEGSVHDVNEEIIPGIKVSDAIAWLEKQGEPKEYDVCDNCDQQSSCVSPCCVKLVEKNDERSLLGVKRMMLI